MQTNLDGCIAVNCVKTACGLAVDAQSKLPEIGYVPIPVWALINAVLALNYLMISDYPAGAYGPGTRRG